MVRNREKASLGGPFYFVGMDGLRGCSTHLICLLANVLGVIFKLLKAHLLMRARKPHVPVGRNATMVLSYFFYIKGESALHLANS